MEAFKSILLVSFLVTWLGGGMALFLFNEDAAKANNKMRKLLIFSGPIVWAALGIGKFLKYTEKFFK